MKVLVTGAPGWLGNQLVKELIKNKYKVRCLVLKGQDCTYLKEIGAQIFEGDITRKETLPEAMKGVETVFHCAGLIHPKRIRELYSINFYGTKNMIDTAIEQGVKRFIFVSSNSPVGTNKSEDKLFSEEDSYNPYMHYGRSKMLAEIYVNRISKENKIETVIIRPCWFYGPGQPLRQTTFFKMIKKGNPIMFGKGNNIRSMTYIDNLVQSLVLASRSNKAPGQTYWIADENPYTTNEIYNTISEILNVKDFKPRKLPSIVSWCCRIADKMIQSLGFYQQEIHVAGEMSENIACSVEKAKKELKYSPNISLKEGMKRSIEWCRENGVQI